ncbi:hypothetical protein [Facklamia miroungae]|uniref:Uncharacterized protein n=1 Tax=Facklamia miroungae TaxID=120956 RepID=A0A1G7TXZ1_9LACT|nr:hypothetical protein [Facklamia miroungae]NKZ30001.1 hypothetical protein [Facklamia miroungae]SDG39599.1 hypothetical protein SAMN05421791_10768 [Facklamia miroungae]
MNYYKQMIKYFSIIGIGLILLVGSLYGLNAPIVGKLTPIEGKEKLTDLPEEYVQLSSQNSFFSLPQEMTQNKSGDYQLSRSNLSFKTLDFEGNKELKALAKEVPTFFKGIDSLKQIYQGDNYYFWIESDFFSDEGKPIKVHFLDFTNKKELIKDIPIIKPSINDSNRIYLQNAQGRQVDGKYYLMCLYNIESGNPNSGKFSFENTITIYQLDEVNKENQFKLINEESYNLYDEEETFAKEVWFNEPESNSRHALDAPFIQTTYNLENGKPGPFFLFDFKEQAWQEIETNYPKADSLQILTADSSKLYVLEFRENKNYLGYYSFEDQTYTGEIPIEHFESLNNIIDIQVVDYNKEGETLLALNDFDHKYYGYYNLNSGQTDSLFKIDFPKEYHKFLDLINWN